MTSTPSTRTPLRPAARPSWGRVLRDQRKILLVAAVLMTAAVWILTPLGGWRLGTSVAVGFALGLANHLATEYWLLKVIAGEERPSRKRMAVNTFLRLLVLTGVAVAVAVLFWPEGIGLLLGLAIFRLIALVMTGVPLLKELRNP